LVIYFIYVNDARSNTHQIPLQHSKKYIHVKYITNAETYDRRHTKEKRKTLDIDIRGVLMGGSQACISLPHVDHS